MDFSTISIPSEYLIKPCVNIEATGPLVFLVTSLAASIPPVSKASSTLASNFLELVADKFKVMILSKATAKPKIKHINIGVIKSGPPSMNFSLITWWNPTSSSTTSSSTTTGLVCCMVTSAVSSVVSVVSCALEITGDSKTPASMNKV